MTSCDLERERSRPEPFRLNISTTVPYKLQNWDRYRDPQNVFLIVCPMSNAMHISIGQNIKSFAVSGV